MLFVPLTELVLGLCSLLVLLFPKGSWEIYVERMQQTLMLENQAE
jgi:hypothetical protein